MRHTEPKWPIQKKFEIKILMDPGMNGFNLKDLIFFGQNLWNVFGLHFNVTKISLNFPSYQKR